MTTTHWLHKLLTVGLDKLMIICPRYLANHYTKLASRVSVAFLEATRKLMMLASTREK
jgi:hypothetical protein